MRKVLYSPGFGAGWSSWVDGGRKEKEFFLFDQKLIDFLDGGGLKSSIAGDAAIDDFVARFHEAFPESRVYFGGWLDLTVGHVPDGFLFRICEDEGEEKIVLQEDDEWF